MVALLLGVLLTLSPPDTTGNLEACLSIGPGNVPPPVTSLSGAQRTWLADQFIPRDTLQAHLSRVLRARRCYRNLNPAQIARPYIGNIIDTYDAEAELRAALRQFSEAFAAYKEGLSYLRSQSPTGFVGYEAARATWPSALHQQQGYLHYLLGNLSSSIEHYLRAFRTASTLDEQIENLLNVGILHQRTQDYQSARHYYQRAQQRLQTANFPAEEQSEFQARTYQVLADLLLERTLNTEFDRGALKRARNMARRGRRLAEPGSERHARTSSLLSETLGYLGIFDEAYRLNEEVRQYTRTNDDTHFQTFALLKLGVLHLQTERWNRADSTLHEALSRAEALEDLDYQRRILRALGRLHEIQTDWTEAEAYYRQGVAVIEKYRESLTATQWSSTAFAQWRDVHRGLVRTLLAQDRPREALAALDRTRARHLQDLRTRAQVANQLLATARARLDSLSRTLSDVRTRLGTETLSDDEEARLRTREAALMTARKQLLRIDSTVAARPSIEETSEALAKRDRALVSYFLDNPWPVYDRSPRSAAFVLTADTLRVFSLPGLTQDSVRTQVQAISPLFAQQGKPQRINAMHFDLRPLRRLHDQLYAPVAQHLPTDQPLTVVPDGPMFHVPFSMLATATPGGRYGHAQARFVLHERPTTTELATSMVGDASPPSFDQTTVAPDLAAFGVSEFDTLRTIPSALRASLPEAASDSALALPPLPGVRSEMNTLNTLFGDVETFLDEAATESAFTVATQRAGVLHLASHAFVHPSSPLQNAFLLRPDSTSDGILFLHELQSQDRTIPLAVLSGCSTARGTLRGGEGMAGLQYAFRAMGAQSTVSNLWPAADEPSTALMRNFYRNLREGLPKDRALRQAKLTYLETHPDQASPFFWAPAVLYGSPQPVPLEAASSGLLSWLGWSPVLGLLLLLTGISLWYFHRSAGSSLRMFAS